jgi:hypothetical protein
MPDLKHPLMGANIATLFASMRTYGGVDTKYWPYAACFAGAAVARLPFTLLERISAGNLKQEEDEGCRPIFIVGHWRSGTTHLHNLLACSPEFGIITPLASGLPWELLTLARWLQPLLTRSLPENRGVDNVAVTIDSPQEDEIPLASMQLLSVFHALYYPRNFRRLFEKTVFFEGATETEIAHWRQSMLYFFGKVRKHQNGKVPLVKNPAHTARVRHLLKIWPRARFIHIYRNPYTVYQSTLHYYRKLLPELSLQTFTWQDVQETVLHCYPQLLNRFYSDVEGLPADRVIEIRFEDLEENPLEAIEEIMHIFQLGSRHDTRKRITAYLERIKDYRKNKLHYSDQNLGLVRTHWGAYLRRWNYQIPTW